MSYPEERTYNENRQCEGQGVIRTQDVTKNKNTFQNYVITEVKNLIDGLGMLVKYRIKMGIGNLGPRSKQIILNETQRLKTNR